MAWLRKGEEAKDHKYIRRIPMKSGYRYVYEEPKDHPKVNEQKTTRKFDALVDSGKSVVNTYSKVAVQSGSIQEAPLTGHPIVLNFKDDKGNEFEYGVTDSDNLESGYLRWTNFSNSSLTKIESFKRLFSAKPVSYVTIDGDLGDTMVEQRVKDYLDGKHPSTLIEHAIETGYARENRFLRSQFSALPKKESVADSLIETNPNYKTGAKEYRYNCYSCAIAMDLRQRGYDVEAIADDDGEYLSVFANIYDFPESYGLGVTVLKDYDATGRAMNKTHNPESYRDLSYLAGDDAPKYVDWSSNRDTGVSYSTKTGSMTSEDWASLQQDIVDHLGENTSGLVAISWRLGGGHAVYYQCRNGTIAIYDAQSGERMRGEELIGLTADIEFFRTDNLCVNEGVLRYVQKAG